MKRITIVICLLGGIFLCEAQQVIEMNADKVTQFIFPEPISNIKGGYLSSQILEEVNDNVLYMQPTGSFPETNLNVITVGGQYFHFTLRYAVQPEAFSHIIKESDAFYSKDNEGKTEKKSLKDSFETQSRSLTSSNDPLISILSESGYLVSRNSVRYKKMYLTVKGIYVYDDKLYFRILIENKSNISYDVDMVSFLVTAKEKAKNATQESTQFYWNKIQGNHNIMPANGNSELIFEFDKFTIGKDKILNVNLVEKGGERNLVLPIDNDWVINAREVKL